MEGECGGRGAGGSRLGSLTGWLCVAASPAAPCAWGGCVCVVVLTVLCHIKNKGPALFFALLCECLALFFF